MTKLNNMSFSYMWQAHTDPGHTKLRRVIDVIWGSVAGAWYEISWYHTVEKFVYFSAWILCLQETITDCQESMESGAVTPRESEIWECVNLYIIKQFLFLLSKPYASPSLIMVFVKESWWIGTQRPESPSTWYQSGTSEMHQGFRQRLTLRDI